jgi:hypothetical protein
LVGMNDHSGDRLLPAAHRTRHRQRGTSQLALVLAQRSRG